MKKKILYILIQWNSKKQRYLKINGKNTDMEIGDIKEHREHMLLWKLLFRHFRKNLWRLQMRQLSIKKQLTLIKKLKIFKKTQMIKKFNSTIFFIENNPFKNQEKQEWFTQKKLELK